MPSGARRGAFAAACAFSTAAAAVRRPTFPQLLRLKLPGALSAWEAAGFSRNNDSDDVALHVGGIDIGVGDTLALPSWGWRDGPKARDLPDASRDCPAYWEDLRSEEWTELSIAGIQTAIDDVGAEILEDHLEERAGVSTAHPNGADGLYSICVTTPDLGTTVRALESAGVALRRMRKPGDPASQLSTGLQMAFFKFGVPDGQDVILELIAPGSDGTPLPGGFPIGTQAQIAGLVVSVPDLGQVAALLGPERLSTERAAVQGRGRRIAALKHEAVGLPLPLAFMTPSTSTS